MTPYLSEPMVIRLEGMINPKVVRYSIIIEIDIFCQDLHEVSPWRERKTARDEIQEGKRGYRLT